VSAVLNSESVVSSGADAAGAFTSSENSSSGDKPETVAVREGDWKAYLNSIAKYRDDKSLIERYGSLHAYKRACAMAYLGKRAQLHGGVCSTRHPHVITPHFIASLEVANKAQRYARYPWLEALMTVLAEIERIQDEISSGATVISLVPSR
jgi:hypothetical protein